MSPFVSILLGLIGGGLSAALGAIVAIRRVRSEIKRNEAEALVGEATASSTVVDAAIRLLEPYKAQMDRQELGLASLRTRVVSLERHVAILEAQIRAAGGTPPPRPNEQETPV